MKLSPIIRSYIRNPLNSTVIIISLALGLACFNLLFMFINRELETDSFQNNKERIYALKSDDPWVPGGKMYFCKKGSAEYIKNNFSQVEEFCRLKQGGALKIIAGNEEYSDIPAILSASENFFSFFSYKLLTNNPQSVLQASDNIVISSDLAKKYFGKDDAVGEVIKLVRQDKVETMIVTGIFEKPIANTQIVFDMVRMTEDTDSRCYLRLTSPDVKEDVEKLFSENNASIPVINTGTPNTYYLEPFLDAYFDQARASAIEANRNKKDIWIALVIALMIIGIASFNYLGLLNNKLVEKQKDYIIRRINGGSKAGLIFDFILENVIVLGVSFVISLFIIQELLPFFNELTGSNLSEKFIFRIEQLPVLIMILIFLVFLTLIFILLRIQSTIDTNLLKPGNHHTIKRIQLPAFNIFQLSSSIVLIICSIVITKQIKFISDKPIGLDRNVIEVKLSGPNTSKVSVFKEELLKNSSIQKVSVVSASPLLEHFLLLLKYNQDGVEKQYSPAGFTGDANYLSTLGLELIKGEGFSEDLTLNNKKCLVNQSFAALFSDQGLIGKGIPGMEDQIIIGIVKDFNYSSLKSLIEPAFISYSENGTHLMVKALDNQEVQARETISQIWKKIIPDYPVNIETIGDRYEVLHQENKNYIRLIGACSGISLFLSMIGLFAVSYQTSHRRTKEIGIRKINGATIKEILMLLNKDITKWLAISFLLAFPLGWYIMNKWLQNFAYKTEFSWWIFALSGIVTIGIVILTVSWQSWRAATRNPVEALRYE
ncbi:MAG: ABC transporter permease [Bacteroidales bacterium]|nr:ABC transporter permease [Bacteroidales bacterium]